MLKRMFDIFSSALGLVIFAPFFILISVLIKFSSPGPIFYRGLRTGKDFRPFRIFKFRTMVANADKIGGPSTSGDDPRLTKIGKFLRRYKLDELPQLINVLRGEMSLVGPRPEVPEEVATYSQTERKILSVKPGITDFASLWNVHEEELLKGSSDPHQAYREKIKPTKLRLALEYVEHQSFFVDLKILFKTFIKIFE